MLINFRSDLPCCFPLKWGVNICFLKLDENISNNLCAKQSGMQSHKEQIVDVQEDVSGLAN